LGRVQRGLGASEIRKDLEESLDPRLGKKNCSKQQMITPEGWSKKYRGRIGLHRRGVSKLGNAKKARVTAMEREVKKGSRTKKKRLLTLGRNGLQKLEKMFHKETTFHPGRREGT